MVALPVDMGSQFVSSCILPSGDEIHALYEKATSQAPVLV